MDIHLIPRHSLRNIGVMQAAEGSILPCRIPQQARISQVLPETTAQAWRLVARAEVEQELCAHVYSNEAVTTLFHLALCNVSQKWTMPIRDWKAALTRFTVDIVDRIFVN